MNFNYKNIKEYWAGKLSPEEIDKLSYYLSDPENNEEVVSFMQLLWEENIHHSSEANFNEEKVLHGIYNIIGYQKESNLRKTRFGILRYAAVLLVMIGIGGGVYFARNFVRSESHHIVYSTNSGERKHVMLPDGSNVWLNSNSHISYKESILAAKRKVQMLGEVFFEVAVNKEKTFVVECGPIKITVVGTHFNVTAYPLENKIITTLTEGRILLNTESHRPIALMIGQQAVFEKNEKLLTIHSKIPTERILSWKDNKLVFRNESLQSVFESLGHWYGVSFLLTLHYTATITDESLNEILTLLSHTIDITYHIDSGKVIINREE